MHNSNKRRTVRSNHWKKPRAIENIIIHAETFSIPGETGVWSIDPEVEHGGREVTCVRKSDDPRIATCLWKTLTFGTIVQPLTRDLSK